MTKTLSELLMERDKYCTYQHMLAQFTQHIAVASFTLDGKLLAEMWPRVFFIFFNFNWRKARCFILLVVRTIIFLHLYLSWFGTGALHRLHHPLYAASTTAVRIVVRDSRLELQSKST